MFSRKIKVTRVNAECPAGVIREDISCGVSNCDACLSQAQMDASHLSGDAPVLVPDASTLLTYADVFESNAVSNVLILNSTLAEVGRRNRSAAAKIQRVVADVGRKFYIFANDRHKSTSVVRAAQETDDDFNLRSIKSAISWLRAHNSLLSSVFTLVSTAPERYVDARVPCESLKDMLAKSLGAQHPLLDRLATVAPSERSNDQEEYWADERIQAALGTELVRGKLRTSDGSPFYGEIRGKFGDRGERIALIGRGSINRAIHDDVVAVLVDPVDKWKAPLGTVAPPSDASLALKAGFTATGRVVGIIDRGRRPYCGSIDVDEGVTAEKLSGTVSVLFRPKSSRIPRIRISTQQAAVLKSKRLRVVIDDWPATSAYPFGHYTDVIGEIGDKDTEATVILLENDIPHYDFSEAVYDCLPKGKWNIEDSEVLRRRDLRDLCVCSVDPLNCKDIDDALHYRTLANGNIEVGVHIADVSHFVLEGTPMDVEAAKRSTSVYLVDRRINMLPQLLTENLCSIVQHEDRYAFSMICEFEPNDDMTLVSEWFGKTIIRSRAALYYGDAQHMIDDESDRSELADSLRGLMHLSRILKRRRDEAGALTLGSQEFKFKIDNDHVNPTDMVQYKTFETNSMIEEWMLYANVAAARRCYESFPSHAMLRRHQPPAEGSVDELNKALASRGLPRLDTRTSKALNIGLNNCVDSADPFLNKLVRMLTTRCLKQAQYFCSGDLVYEEFLHYGLAMPIYTHFTSPIRRYADVIVHRQLAAITGFGDFSPSRISSEQMAAIAANINYRHEMAQKAGRDSQNLFTGFFLRKYADTAIPIEDGYVVKTTESHVSVMVPAIGQEGRVPIALVTDKFAPLDKVRVQISLVREGDVLSAKLAFRIIERTEQAQQSDLKRHRDE